MTSSSCPNISLSLRILSSFFHRAAQVVSEEKKKEILLPFDKCRSPSVNFSCSILLMGFHSRKEEKGKEEFAVGGGEAKERSSDLFLSFPFIYFSSVSFLLIYIHILLLNSRTYANSKDIVVKTLY